MGTTDKPNIQGEGDYEAARRYRQEGRDLIEPADIDKAAHEAAPKSPAEQSELEEAERIGRSHSKGGPARDMALTPTAKEATKPSPRGVQSQAPDGVPSPSVSAGVRWAMARY